MSVAQIVKVHRDMWEYREPTSLQCKATKKAEDRLLAKIESGEQTVFRCRDCKCLVEKRHWKAHLWCGSCGIKHGQRRVMPVRNAFDSALERVQLLEAHAFCEAVREGRLIL